MAKITSSWLSRIDYVEGLLKQDEALTQVQSGHEIILLGCEHSGVITLGKRANRAVDILINDKEVQHHDLLVFAVERGGHATVHGTGQLVIYPIVPLRALSLGVRQYLELLEKVSVACLKSFGIDAFRHGEEPGLYTTQGKIVFFGVRVREGVSQHGLAINVLNNLSEFKVIRSCGLVNETFDRMAAYKGDISTQGVFHSWCMLFIAEVSRLAKTVVH
jgi:lipoate-protein ligase B